MNTINNAIPFVPENTTDPAAGLNLSLNQIDALLQVLVQTVGENTPPGSPSNGARYIVGTAPTGAWVGQANKLARFLDGVWQFFDARYALNAADGLWYVRQASTWVSLAGSAPAWGSITGTLSAQTDLQSALDGKVGNSDSRLTDAREWTATTISQAEAEAGTATTRRAWTAQRVRQAIVAWWNSVSSAWGRGFVSSADAAAGRTALGLGSAATRTALGTTGALYSRDSILGTVSQSGGVPTGAIIERGSNANGEFVRYADGTQICRMSVAVPAATEERTNRFGSTSGTMYFAQTQVPLPASFNGLSYMSFPDFLDSGGGFASTITTGKTASSQGVRVWSYENTNTHTLNLLSIGRWF